MLDAGRGWMLHKCTIDIYFLNKLYIFQIELPQTIWSAMVFRRNRLVLFNLKYKQLHVIEVDLDKRQVPVSKRNKSKLYRNEVVDSKSEWKCVELRTQTVDRMVICGRVEVNILLINKFQWVGNKKIINYNDIIIVSFLSRN